MSREPLEKEVKARVSKRTYRQLEALLKGEEEGITISDLVRRAVGQYVASKNPEKVREELVRAADEDPLP